MKKMIAVILLMLMGMLMYPGSALAQGWGGFEYAVGAVQQQEGRVKMRARASKTSDVLGQYYPGTPLEVLSVSGTWAKIRIGDREGYMMREFILHDSDWAGPGEEGEWGQIIPVEGSQEVRLHQRPDGASPVITYLNYDDHILVLGTIGDDWLHIRVYKEELGKAVYGYASSAQIGKPDGRAQAWIDIGRADQTVNMREKPNRDGKILGRYFSGVGAWLLYDDHVAEDGWQKVRIGNEIGYIMDEYLNVSRSGMRQSFRPPMTEIKGDQIAVYRDASGKMKREMLIKYDPFQMLGIWGGYYHVRIEGLYGEADTYGFIRTSDVKTPASRSASTAAVTNRETPCYWGTVAGDLQQQRMLPKGTKVTVYYAASACNEGESDYIYPEAAYLFIGAELMEGGGIEAYVPIECIDYDPALEYPEIMTLG